MAVATSSHGYRRTPSRCPASCGEIQRWQPRLGGTVSSTPDRVGETEGCAEGGGGQLYECRLGLRRRAIWWTSRKAGITRPRRSNPLLEHASKTPGACPRTGTDFYSSSVPSVEDTRSGTASPYALNTQTEYQQAAAHFRARATSPNPMNPSSAAPGAGTMSNRMVLCAVTSNVSRPFPMPTAQ